MFKKIVLLLIVVYSTLFFSAFSFSGVESVNVQHESGVQVIDIRRSDDVISKENIDMDFEKLTKVDTSSENSLDEALNIMRRDPFAAIKFIQENEELANRVLQHSVPKSVKLPNFGFSSRLISAIKEDGKLNAMEIYLRNITVLLRINKDEGSICDGVREVILVDPAIPA